MVILLALLVASIQEDVKCYEPFMVPEDGISLTLADASRIAVSFFVGLQYDPDDEDVNRNVHVKVAGSTDNVDVTFSDREGITLALSSERDIVPVVLTIQSRKTEEFTEVARLDVCISPTSSCPCVEYPVTITMRPNSELPKLACDTEQDNGDSIIFPSYRSADLYSAFMEEDRLSQNTLAAFRRYYSYLDGVFEKETLKMNDNSIAFQLPSGIAENYTNFRDWYNHYLKFDREATDLTKFYSTYQYRWISESETSRNLARAYSDIKHYYILNDIHDVAFSLKFIVDVITSGLKTAKLDTIFSGLDYKFAAARMTVFLSEMLERYGYFYVSTVCHILTPDAGRKGQYPKTGDKCGNIFDSMEREGLAGFNLTLVYDVVRSVYMKVNTFGVNNYNSAKIKTKLLNYLENCHKPMLKGFEGRFVAVQNNESSLHLLNAIAYMNLMTGAKDPFYDNVSAMYEYFYNNFRGNSLYRGSNSIKKHDSILGEILIMAHLHASASGFRSSTQDNVSDNQACLEPPVCDETVNQSQPPCVSFYSVNLTASNNPDDSPRIFDALYLPYYVMRPDGTSIAFDNETNTDLKARRQFGSICLSEYNQDQRCVWGVIKGSEIDEYDASTHYSDLELMQGSLISFTNIKDSDISDITMPSGHYGQFGISTLRNNISPLYYRDATIETHEKDFQVVIGLGRVASGHLDGLQLLSSVGSYNFLEDQGWFSTGLTDSSTYFPNTLSHNTFVVNNKDANQASSTASNVYTSDYSFIGDMWCLSKDNNTCTHAATRIIHVPLEVDCKTALNYSNAFGPCTMPNSAVPIIIEVSFGTYYHYTPVTKYEYTAETKISHNDYASDLLIEEEVGEQPHSYIFLDSRDLDFLHFLHLNASVVQETASITLPDPVKIRTKTSWPFLFPAGTNNNGILNGWLNVFTDVQKQVLHHTISEKTSYTTDKRYIERKKMQPEEEDANVNHILFTQLPQGFRDFSQPSERSAINPLDWSNIATTASMLDPANTKRWTLWGDMDEVPSISWNAPPMNWTGDCTDEQDFINTNWLEENYPDISSIEDLYVMPNTDSNTIPYICPTHLNLAFYIKFALNSLFDTRDKVSVRVNCKYGGYYDASIPITVSGTQEHIIPLANFVPKNITYSTMPSAIKDKFGISKAIDEGTTLDPRFGWQYISSVQLIKSKTYSYTTYSMYLMEIGIYNYHMTEDKPVLAEPIKTGSIMNRTVSVGLDSSSKSSANYYYDLENSKTDAVIEDEYDPDDVNAIAYSSRYTSSYFKPTVITRGGGGGGACKDFTETSDIEELGVGTDAEKPVYKQITFTLCSFTSKASAIGIGTEHIEQPMGGHPKASEGLVMTRNYYGELLTCPGNSPDFVRYQAGLNVSSTGEKMKYGFKFLHPLNPGLMCETYLIKFGTKGNENNRVFTTVGQIYEYSGVSESEAHTNATVIRNGVSIKALIEAAPTFTKIEIVPPTVLASGTESQAGKPRYVNELKRPTTPLYFPFSCIYMSHNKNKPLPVDHLANANRLTMSCGEISFMTLVYKHTETSVHEPAVILQSPLTIFKVGVGTYEAHGNIRVVPHIRAEEVNTDNMGMTSVEMCIMNSRSKIKDVKFQYLELAEDSYFDEEAQSYVSSTVVTKKWEAQLAVHKYDTETDYSSLQDGEIPSISCQGVSFMSEIRLNGADALDIVVKYKVPMPIWKATLIAIGTILSAALLVFLILVGLNMWYIHHNMLQKCPLYGIIGPVARGILEFDWSCKKRHESNPVISPPPPPDDYKYSVAANVDMSYMQPVQMEKVVLRKVPEWEKAKHYVAPPLVFERPKLRPVGLNNMLVTDELPPPVPDLT